MLGDDSLDCEGDVMSEGFGAGWRILMLVFAGERESLQRANQVLMWLRTTCMFLSLALRPVEERRGIEVCIAESSANWGIGESAGIEMERSLT